MTLAVPQKGNPACSISARVAAKLYTKPLHGRPAGSIPRGRFTKRNSPVEMPAPITVGQVLRAGLVFAVALMLAPTPHIDADPHDRPAIAQPK